MASSIERLAEQAMKLPPELRARLADLLVASVDAKTLADIDQARVSEARRRRDDVRSGRANAVPGKAGLRRVRTAIDR